MEGSRLLGPVLDVPSSVLEFIADYQAPIVPAWRAFLVVEDEPKQVWDAYVAQLTADVTAGGQGGALSITFVPPGVSRPGATVLHRVRQDHEPVWWYPQRRAHDGQHRG